jgi:hypothetical protein
MFALLHGDDPHGEVRGKDVGRVMRRKTLVVLGILSVLGMIWEAHARVPEGKRPAVGAVKINPHPGSLEGKTVLLRWNGKFNGDRLLNRLGELLTKQVKNVRVIRMWEVDPSTAVMSESPERSREIAGKMIRLRPDIVIASQADCGFCTFWLVMDQLHLEKAGIPTVTVTTTAYEDLVRSAMKEQGVGEMSLVVTEHPLAGHSAEVIRVRAEELFPEILRAATRWQPSGR